MAQLIRIIVCVLFISTPFLLRAQSQGNLSLIRLENNSKSGDLVRINVKGDNKRITNILNNYDATILGGFRGYLDIELPVENVRSFIANSCIADVEYQYHTPVILADTNLKNNNIIPVHNGDMPLQRAYTGKGVVVGIIDTGIDFNHPDFKNVDGTTRILSIWDQANGTTPPTGYTYGTEWTKNQIDNGSCTHQDPSSYFGHGTKVSGVAAGNGMATGKYKGSAPEADIVVVASDFDSNSWLATIADAVEYIAIKAEEVDKPFVINISAGTYQGSHDGRDIGAQRIDSIMKAAPGRAICCSAGNSGEVAPYHLGYDITNDTSFTWFSFNSAINYFGPYSPNGAVYMEFYADTADLKNVTFSVGIDRTAPFYENISNTAYINMEGLLTGSYPIDVNGIHFDKLYNNNGDEMANVYYGFDLINDNSTYLLQVIIDPDSISGYNYRFNTTGDGHIDAWGTENGILGTSNIIDTVPSPVDFPEVVNYMFPDSLMSIVSSFTCLPDIITVGNYVNKNQYLDLDSNLQVVTTIPPGERYSSSSLGPTRTGIIKPTVIAPGSTTMAPGPLYIMQNWITAAPYAMDPDSMHVTANGTSIASPGAAGVVALLLEKCPGFDYLDIKNTLINSARVDSFTGTVPNNIYGYGKPDALTAIQQHISTVELTYMDTVLVCKQLVLETNQLYPSYSWNNGSFNDQIVVSQTGEYYTVVTDTGGCTQKSNTVMVNVEPFSIPNTTLNLSDSTACESEQIVLQTSSPYNSYLWSTGENSSTVSTNQTDEYWVVVTDDDGCKAYSDTANLTFLIAPLDPVISVFNDTSLISSMGNNYQWSFNGSPLPIDTNQIMYAQDTGYYSVEITNANNCSAESDSVFVQPPPSLPNGLDNNKLSSTVIFPNPFSNKLNLVFTNAGEYTIEAFDLIGKQTLNSTVHIKNPTIHEIETTNFPKGVYIFYLRGVEHSTSFKVIKQ